MVLISPFALYKLDATFNPTYVCGMSISVFMEGLCNAAALELRKVCFREQGGLRQLTFDN